MSQRIDIDLIEQNKVDRYVYCFEEKENKKLFCKIVNCKSSFSGQTTAIKHLKRAHPQIAEKIKQNKHSVEITEKPVKIEILMSPAQLWKSVMQLIVLSAIPFTILHSEGFKGLIDPILDGFKNIGNTIAMNIPNIQLHINSEARKLKDRIKDEVKNKMLCLMLDIGSRHNRSIFGINVAFWSNGALQIRTIGMQTLKVSQSAIDLYQVVKNTLNGFGITLEQLISVTTDNAKNLKKLIKVMGKEVTETELVNSSEENDIYIISDDEDDGDDDVYFSNNDERFDPEIINDDQYFQDLLSNVRNEFSGEIHNNLINGICCAAHCLHLVVMGGIIESNIVYNLIEKCRNLAKKLRTPSMRFELKEKKLKIPILDVKTRWSSVFNMVCILIVFSF